MFMAIINFLILNWDSVLIVLAAIALICFLIWKGQKSIVYQMIYKIVTELEKQYGGGTGSLKLAAAIDILYPKLPKVIKWLVNAETLTKWIEDGLTKAKDIWQKNAAINQYINNETESKTEASV